MSPAYLIQEANGRFYAKYQRHGKWTKKSLNTTKRVLAQRRFGAFLKQQEEQELLYSEITPVPLDDFAEEYLRYVKSAKSLAHYQRQRQMWNNLILPFLEKKTLTPQVTSRRIEEFMAQRKESVKAVSVNKELFSIKHAFKKAEEWKYVLTSPARIVKALKSDGQIRVELLTKEQYEHLLDIRLPLA